MKLTRLQKSMLHRFYAYGFLKNLQFFGPLIMLFFTLEKGLSLTQFGVLVGIREVGVALLEVPTGIVADVTGRRRAMMLCFTSYLVSFVVFTLAHSLAFFAVGMVLFAMGETFRSGTHKAMIMQHLDIEGLQDLKTHYYGRTRAASRAGSMVVAVLGPFFCLLFGLRYVFLVTMVPYALALVLMATYPRELDGEVEKHTVGKRIAHHTFHTFRSILRTPQLGRMLVNGSVFEAFFKVSKDYLQVIVLALAISWGFLAASDVAGADNAIDSADAIRESLPFLLTLAVVYFVVHANEIFSSIHSARFAEKMNNMARAMNRLYWAFAAVFALTGACLAATFFPEPWRSIGLVAAVGLIFLFYTFNNLRKPVVIGFLSDRIDKQQRATVLSVESQLRAVMAFMIAPLFGYVADNAPMPPEATFSPFVFIVGAVILLVLGLALKMSEHGTEQQQAGIQAEEAA